MACAFCGKGKKNHRSCADAYGLDYDPRSPQDATAFLIRREKILAEM